MKIYPILLFTSLFIGTSSLFSQWHAIYYPYQYFDLPFLEAMDFKNNQNGFAAGESYILRTSDGGDNWDTVYKHTSPWMFTDILYIDSITILAVGGHPSNIVMKSVDNGNTWNTSNMPTNVYSTFFTNSSTGFLCGSNGSMYKTMNGGNTWSTLNTNINSHLSSVFFVNDSIGFASGNDLIIRTKDGGNSWSQYNFNSTLAVSFRKIHFPSDSIGYALDISNEKIYKTVDQGNSWILLNSAINAFFATSLYFADDTTGYVTSKFNISKTTDGGNTWFDQQSVPNYGNSFHDDLMDIQMLSADTGFAIGWGQFYRTFNGGGLTSIQNISSASENKLQLYPNPAINSVKISFSSYNFQIKIFNLNGSLVKITEAPSSTTLNIDVSAYPRGVYLVQAIMNDGNIYSKKLIISN